MTDKDKYLPVISGAGSKKKPKKQRPPYEAPNTLQSAATGRILDLLAYGPIKGVVDGAKGVYLDDTPVQNPDGTFNFEGVTVEFREGTPEQPVIRGFSDISNVREIGTEVRYETPIVRTIQNVNATAAIVTIRLNALYSRNNETGDTLSYELPVKVEVEQRGSWSTVVNDKIQGKTVAPYERSYRIPLPKGSSSAPRSIRVSRLNEESETQEKQDTLFWSRLTEVVEVQQNYPGCALVGVEVDARLFSNSLPSRKYLTDLSIIQVPSNYDPYTRSYNGLWNGQFKWSWSDNPAWCFYDLATNPIIGAGLPDVNKFALYEIAKYCDELVDDGYGGREPRFTCNTIFTGQEDAINALSTLASVFRGMAYWGSDTVEVVGDKPGPIRRQVTPADVLGGEFVYRGTALKDRHSVAVVMWNDPDSNYDQVPEVVELPEAVELLGHRETQLTAVACSSRGQARRLGLWALYSEFYETQIIEFSTTVKNADFRPGDYIEVMDPYRIGSRLGGKVVDFASTTVTLDEVPPDLKAGWYITLEQDDKSLVRREISQVKGNVVVLRSSTPKLFKGAGFVLSNPNLAARIFRIMSVTEGENFTYSVTGVEHNPGKYDFVEKGLKLPDRPTSLLPSGSLPQPTDLKADSHTKLVGGTLHLNSTISWTPPDDPRVDSYVLDAKGPEDFSYRTLYTGPGVSFDLEDVQAGTWYFRVKSVSREYGSSQWLNKSIFLSDLLQPIPPESLSFTATSFTITVIPNLSVFSLSEYEFWRSSAALVMDEIESNATYLGQGHWITDVGLNHGTTYFYYVRAVNAYGKSTWVAGQETTREDVEEILEAIFDKVNAGPNGQWLQSEIEKIAANTEDLTLLNSDLHNINNAIREVEGYNRELQNQIEKLNEDIRELEDVQSWNQDIGYLEGELVKFNKTIYRAIKDTPAGIVPPNLEYWESVGGFDNLSDLVSALVVEVRKNTSEIHKNNGRITSLSEQQLNLVSRVSDTEKELKAQSAALQNLSTKTEQLSNGILTNTEAITTLRSSLQQLDSRLGTKADASALEKLSTEVIEISGNTYSNSSKITVLTGRVEKAEENLDATAEAVNSLTTTVDDLGSVSKELNSLKATYRDENHNGELEGALSQWDNKAQIIEEREVRTAQNMSTSRRLTNLTSSVNKNSSEITRVEEVTSNLKETSARAMMLMESKVDGVEKDLTAAIQLEAKTRATEDEATANRLSALQVKVDKDITAAIKREEEARIETEMSLAQSIDSLTSRMPFEIEAAVYQETLARSREDAALGRRIDTVQASVGGLSSSVQTISRAQANLKGEADAMWGVKLQLNRNGQYVTTGISAGISNSGGVLQSNFIVQAQTFVVQDGFNGEGQAAFAVSQGKVVIRSALIQDASITNAKIGNAAVNTLKIAGRAVNFPASSYASNRFVWNTAPNDWKTLQTLIVNCSGESATISCSAELIHALADRQLWAQVRLRRGNDVIWETNSPIGIIVHGAWSTIVSFSVDTTPPPGTNYFYFEILRDRPLFQEGVVFSRSITFNEMKR